VLFFLMLIYSYKLQAQKSYSATIEYNILATDITEKSHAVALIYSANQNIKTIYTDEESVETFLYGTEKVRSLYTKGKVNVCGEGYAEEIKAMRQNKEWLKKKNLKINFTYNSNVIAGYVCYSAIVNYEYKFIGTTWVEYENHIWFTNELKSVDDFFTGDVDDVWGGSRFLDTLKKTEGFIMKQEVYLNHEKVAVAEVTELKEYEIESAVFKLDLSPCKKVLAPKQYKKWVESYRRAKDSQTRLQGG